MQHSFMAEKIIPLSQAAEGYELFNAIRCRRWCLRLIDKSIDGYD